MKLKIGDHCLLITPSGHKSVGIFQGKDPIVRTHVRVDVKFNIEQDWKKFTKVDEQHTYIARKKWVYPYPVVTT